MAATTPLTSDSIWFMIFIASTMHRTCPLVTPRPTPSSLPSVPLRSSRISRIFFRFMSLPLRAFDVRPGPCVHLDPVSHVEEEGNLHHRPGRKLRRLGRPAHRISPKPRIRFPHLP